MKSSTTGLLLLLLLLSQSLAVDYARSSGMGLVTDETQGVRRILLNYPAATDSLPILVPTLKLNGQEGEFQFGLGPIDTTLYLGSRFRREEGEIPVHLNVFFPNDSTIYLRGKTPPFTDISVHYDFIREAYVIAVTVDQMAREVISETFQPKQEIAPGGKIQPAGKTRTAYRKFLNRAIQYGSWVLLGLVAIVMALTLLRKTRGPSAAGRQATSGAGSRSDHAEAPPVSPEPSPEEIEIQIRDLMTREGMSYDEAALRVQFNKENGHGSDE